MAILVLTVQASGQVYRRLGGTASTTDIANTIVPLTGMAFTYFFVNTVPIAIAIALSTQQSAWRIWKTELAPSGLSYVLGAAAAAILLAVTESSGIWFAVLLLLAPLYLTYKMYRTGVESEAKQGAILEAANDAILTMDAQLAIREFNPAAEQMFGHRRTDILGRGVEILLPPTERAVAIGAMSQYLATGRGPLAGRQLELAAVRADGTEFPVELTVALVGSERNRAMTGFIRDITERRQLEEQLRQSQKLEAIGRLASGVAHDFNNILMSIMGSADLILMDARGNDALSAETSEIKLSVQRGAGLTRQLLAFSRRQATSPRHFDLSEVVGGMETMLRRLIGPEIDFRIVRHASPSVRADSAQIEQVILNLVINARDARGRTPDDHAGRSGSRRVVGRDDGRNAGGPLLASERDGYRNGHGRTNAGEAVRALLHDEAAGQRHRTRIVDRVRHREAEWRAHHGHERARARRDVSHLSTCRRRRRGRRGLVIR
jgi:PAS domain S-box-containing protein